MAICRPTTWGRFKWKRVYSFPMEEVQGSLIAHESILWPPLIWYRIIWPHPAVLFTLMYSNRTPSINYNILAFTLDDIKGMGREFLPHWTGHWPRLLLSRVRWGMRCVSGSTDSESGVHTAKGANESYMRFASIELNSVWLSDQHYHNHHHSIAVQFLATT